MAEDEQRSGMGKKRAKSRPPRPHPATRLERLMGKPGLAYTPRVSLDARGAQLWVGGVGFPVEAEGLRDLARQAQAVAQALSGETDPLMDERAQSAFLPMWPGRLPIESGIPGAMLEDPSLTTRQRLLWAIMWRDACGILPRPPKLSHATVSVYAAKVGCGVAAMRRDLRELHDSGWTTMGPSRNPPVRHAYEIVLHLKRVREPPTKAPALSTPAYETRRPWVVNVLREHGALPVVRVTELVNAKHSVAIPERTMRTTLRNMTQTHLCAWEDRPHGIPGRRGTAMARWYWLRPEALPFLRHDGTLKKGASIPAPGDPVPEDDPAVIDVEAIEPC